MNNHMLKSLVKSVCTSLLAVSFSALAFTEGTDYMTLPTPIPDSDKTLIKVFSYDCPFCYKYDKSVTAEMIKKLDGIVKFEPFALETKAKYGPQAAKFFAVLILKDEAAGVSLINDNSLFKKAKFAYYQAYHDKKERWDGGENDFYKTGFDAVGMTRAELDEAAKNPKIEEKLQRWKASYEVAKIQGIPAYVVNGKYLIYTKNIRSIDGLVDLVKELAAKK